MRKILINFLLSYFIALIAAIAISVTLHATTEIKALDIFIKADVLFLLYLAGSIPFGLIITKFMVKQDVRTIGSGNIGTTNVLRTGNKMAAALTLTFDLLKGLIPVLLLQQYANDLGLPAEVVHYTCLLPVIGHMFPCWLDFKGGKGIATGLGVILAFAWELGLIALITWVAVAKLFKTSSVAGLISFTVTPVISIYFFGWQNSIWLFLLSALVFWAHRDNIKRILSGQETKIDGKPKS